jgi:hypothetical protein
MNFMLNGVTRGALWYTVYGGRQDFVTSELQGREVTIELDDQYVTPAAQLPLLWQNNYRSLLGYLENALYGIHGVVLNAATHNPVPAKVFIFDHDKDSSHVYSDTLKGSFVRLLSPGIWNLTFTATGYHDLTIKDVITVPGQKTDLTVNMEPFLNSIDTTDPETPFMYPNPAKTTIKAVLPQELMGIVNVRIISQTGLVIVDYITVSAKGIPLNIDIETLSGGIYSVIFTNILTKFTSRSRFIVIK